MSMLSALKNTSRLAVLGIAISSAVAIAAPAYAEDAEPSYKIDVDKYYESSRYRVKGYDSYDYCLSDRGIGKALDDYGFEDVEFIKSVGEWKLIALAVFDDYYYVAGIDRCTGDVDYVTKLYGWEDYQQEQYEPAPKRRSTY